MTEALKQTGLPGFIMPKNQAKNGKHADPAAFGDALRSAGNKGKKNADDNATLNLWQRSAANLDGAVKVKLAASDKVNLGAAAKLAPVGDKASKDEQEPDLELDETELNETGIETTAPVAVAPDVAVQFTAALELLRDGQSEEPTPEAEAADTAASGAKAPAIEEKTTAAPTDDVVAQAAATVAVDETSVEIDGARKIAAQTQAATAAPAAQVQVSAQLAARETNRADDAAKPADTRSATADATKIMAADEPSTGEAMDRQADDGKSAAPEARRAEPAAVQSRAAGFADQTALSPAPQAPAGNASAITTAIAGLESLRPGAETVAQMLLRLSSAQSGQVQSLKIQLHPAELGVVTAELRFAGEQLSVELKVENADAYQRLSLDTETIAKSLRSLGFDVDQVSVQQPQMVAAASARADIGGNSAGNFSRDNSSFQSWNSSNGEQRQDGQTGGGGRENGGGRHERNAPARPNSTGSGLYI